MFTVRMKAQCCLLPYVTIKLRSRGSTSESGFSLTIPGLTGIDFEPRQEKNREENLLEQRIDERSNNNSTPPMANGAATTPVFELCLHLWEASALTTAYPLPPLSVVNRPLR